jgi:guanylate kinase
MSVLTGKCIIVSAPSGAGKTTIVKALLASFSQLSFSISACSRAPRPNELNGKDYHFLSLEKFQQTIQEDGFVEWEEVYKNAYYGTLKSEIERIWSQGQIVIFDVDVVGGLNLKKFFGTNALSVFIQPPNEKALEERLRYRNTEAEEKIQQRLQKSKVELGRADEFDVVLVNDVLPTTIEQAEKIITNFINQ